MPGLGQRRGPVGDQQAQRGQRFGDVGAEFLIGFDRPAQRQGRQRFPGQLIAHVGAVKLHHPGVGAPGDVLAGTVEQVGFPRYLSTTVPSSAPKADG